MDERKRTAIATLWLGTRMRLAAAASRSEPALTVARLNTTATFMLHKIISSREGKHYSNSARLNKKRTVDRVLIRHLR